MESRVNQLANLIRADVQADTNKPFSNAQFETALNSQVNAGNMAIPGVNQFVRERYNFLRPLLNSYAQPSDVRLNEIVTSNSGVTRDSSGDADPWVEVHNLGPGPVALSSLYLSDDPSNPTKWQLPSVTLADGEHLVIWLDDETTEGNTHASFRPAAGGGRLYLFERDSQTPVDTVTYSVLNSGQAMMRTGSFGDNWVLTASPTPGAANASSTGGAARRRRIPPLEPASC
jgi:hypothetical protein